MGKGQITIFIIILIVAVIVSSILISVNNKKQIAIMQESEDVNLKQVTPVKIYIEDIMQDLIVEGLFLLGKQGGRIYDNTWPDCLEENKNYTMNHRMCNQSGVYDYSYPDYLAASPYLHKRVGIGINHSRIDAERRITFSSDEPMEQPFAYPHYGKDLRTNYLYGAMQPLPSISSEGGEGSIERQLSRWIEYHLPEILNFTELENRDFTIIRPNERPSVNVEINEKYITAKMNYSLIIKKAESTYNINEFQNEIYSDFRIVYDGINDMIREDISTKMIIYKHKINNASGKQIAMALNPTIESDPKNFMYDIVNVTAWSINYTKRYGYPSAGGNYWFYFIRENRPPDTDTVKPPQVMYYNEYALWECANYMTTKGQSAFDPDEDDAYTKQPFPWFEPKWYQFYSRGDFYYVNDVPTSDGCLEKFDVYILNGFKRLHTEWNSKEFGSSWVEGTLGACGNKDLKVTVLPKDLADVGDVIILKVADEQESDEGRKVTAPERYDEPEIKESGTGRLNDAMSYRLVRCKPSDGDPGCCGKDGFWRFNQKPEPPREPDTLCFGVCNVQKPTVGKNDISYPSCGCDYSFCNDKREVDWVCNHEGKLKYSFELIKPIEYVDCGSLQHQDC